MAFFSRKTHTSLALTLPQMARTLTDTVLEAIAADQPKLALLASRLGCAPQAVAQHPRLLAILQRIEGMFLSWFDPQTPPSAIDTAAATVAPLHVAAGVSLSWMFAVMAAVQDKARALNVPQCFFGASTRFVQGLIEAQEKQLDLQEKGLEEERQYWQEIFENQTEGLCVFDLDGGLYDFNDAYAHLVGYSREELLQKGWLELTLPDDRKEDQKRLSDIMAGHLVRFEKTYIHKDGHEVPILISYRLLKRRTGWAKDRFVATCVDLTDARARERELEEERQYWQEIFESQTEGLSVFDLDGGLYDLNTAYANIVGYSRDELLQLGWKPLTPAAWFAEDSTQIARALQGDLVRYEKSFYHKDGHEVPILISYRLLQRRTGWDKDRLVATCVDLTEARARERALAEEKAKSEQLQAFWQTVFNLTPTGIIVQNRQGQIIDVNDAFAQSHGFANALACKNDVGQRNALALFMAMDRFEESAKAILSAIERGEKVVNETENVRKDGTTFPVLDMAQQILINGEPACIVAQIDLTELKRREREVGELLENAQAYLQRLAAAMLIHDDSDRQGAGRLLQETYNRCVDNLQALIGTVAAAAQALMASSEELTQSQATMGERVNEEAASLEEISANATQLSAAVSENTQHAQHTQALAEDMIDRLAASKFAMNDVVDVVLNAAQGARETTRITKVIENIAFTTNILSLNASVEAARSGDKGRGFAVIAQEIRRLAVQVGEESQKAQNIIHALLDFIGKGEEGVQQVAIAVEQIEAKSHTMTEHIQAITRACEEQDRGLKELTQGIGTIEEGLSQNAAMAEEIHGTGEGLQTQTDRLLSLTRQFELDREVTAFSEDDQQDITNAIRTAIVAHFRWRQRLHEALQHGKTLDPGEVGDFHRCTFGQLLAYNATLQAHPAYGRIHQLHEAFHREGQRIAELLRSGQQQQAKQALEGNSRYNQLTETLIQALEGMAAAQPNPRAAKKLSQSRPRPAAKPLSLSSSKAGEWETF